MKHLVKIFFVAASLASLSVSAQWVWETKEGRKVFSDRVPPVDIPEKSILKRPTQMQVATAKEPVEADGLRAPVVKASAPAAAQIGASAPKPAGIDKELAERKSKAEQAETAKRKSDEDKARKTKAENCERAKLAKLNFDSGARISRISKQGEREYLDEAARTTELKRIQSILESDCK